MQKVKREFTAVEWDNTDLAMATIQELASCNPSVRKAVGRHLMLRVFTPHGEVNCKRGEYVLIDKRGQLSVATKDDFDEVVS